MWLLDHNLPHNLLGFLKTEGLQVETTKFRGWEQLENGKLVEAAAGAGFTCILTRDELFSQAASRALKQHSSMAVVLVTLPQKRGSAYVEAWSTAWRTQKLQPIAGQLLRWPAT